MTSTVSLKTVRGDQRFAVLSLDGSADFIKVDIIFSWVPPVDVKAPEGQIMAIDRQNRIRLFPDDTQVYL